MANVHNVKYTSSNFLTGVAARNIIVMWDVKC